MAKVVSKRVTSWSFSRYSDYKQCPFKAKLKHVDKLKEPPNDAMARGTAIHDLAEGYVKGRIARLPKELKQFDGEFKKLRKIYKDHQAKIVVEDNWAFTAAWEETRWNDWVNCWVRIKLDSAHHEVDGVFVVTDYKTGKFREEKHAEYVEQLELYALAALLLFPMVRVVKPRLLYLDTGVTFPSDEDPLRLEFTRDDVVRLKKLWAKRTAPMLRDTTFAPRPGHYCRYCHFRAGNGGPCKYVSLAEQIEQPIGRR